MWLCLSLSEGEEKVRSKAQGARAKRTARKRGKVKYRPIARFQSNSDPDRFYMVKMDEVGYLSCNCPGWIYMKNGNRTCKHVSYVWANLHDGKGHISVPLTDIPTRQEAERMGYGENKAESYRWTEAHLKIIQL